MVDMQEIREKFQKTVGAVVKKCRKKSITKSADEI